jgi:hypothetical protein
VSPTSTICFGGHPIGVIGSMLDRPLHCRSAGLPWACNDPKGLSGCCTASGRRRGGRVSRNPTGVGARNAPARHLKFPVGLTAPQRRDLREQPTRRGRREYE